jgi:hypothetical protein
MIPGERSIRPSAFLTDAPGTFLPPSSCGKAYSICSSLCRFPGIPSPSLPPREPHPARRAQLQNCFVFGFWVTGKDCKVKRKRYSQKSQRMAVERRTHASYRKRISERTCRRAGCCQAKSSILPSICRRKLWFSFTLTGQKFQPFDVAWNIPMWKNPEHGNAMPGLAAVARWGRGCTTMGRCPALLFRTGTLLQSALHPVGPVFFESNSFVIS